MIHTIFFGRGNPLYPDAWRVLSFKKRKRAFEVANAIGAVMLGPDFRVFEDRGALFQKRCNGVFFIRLVIDAQC